MNMKKFAAGAIAAGGLLAIGSVGFAAAQTGDEPAPGSGMHGTMAGHGQMDHTGMADHDSMAGHESMGNMSDMSGCSGEGQTRMHQAAAAALGITVDELNARLASGKTVADIAAEKGIDLDTIHAAMQTAHPAGHGPGMMRAAEGGTG